MKHTLTRTLGLLWIVLLGFGSFSKAQCPATACRPGRATSSTAPFIQSGIYNVRLGSVSFTGTGYTQGYVDSSCGQSGISVIAGTSFSIQVTTGTQIQENVRVYLDINNNGQFDSTGAELVFSSNSGFTHNGTVTVPSSALLNQKLRLRVATDANISGLPTPCRTPEFGQTRDFWVTALGNTQPPTAAFTSADTLTCSGSVRFTDQSAGAPTSWFWNFGDGTTATDRNPTHFYAASGTYSVKLVARNANGVDSLTKTNYVRFNDTIPVAACVLTTTAPCCNTFITRVTITSLGATVPSLNNPSPSVNGGYEDYTCQIRTRLVQGKRYSINISTGTSSPQATKAWIDGNGNGTFEDSELILNAPAANNPVDTFICPTASASSLGRPVRMRIITDGQGTTVSGCRNPQLGQSEDYTVILVENVLPPVAQFVRVGGTNCDSTYTFRSDSENAITKLYWNFGDGSPLDSSGATVTHTYANPGSYTVSLVAVGPFGRDTLSAANAVTYVAAPAQALCGAPVTNNTCCNIGIFNVQFGGINVNSGSAEEGYQDFTCEGSTSIIAATPTRISIRIGAQQPETTIAWIDYNNDLAFDTTEQVLRFPSGTGVRSTLLTLPSSAVQGVPLRMRILSTANRQTQFDPCAAITFGQYEDYSLVILPNSNPPVAGFGAISRTTCDGNITFTDSTLNATSYRWFFGDGDSSTAAAPSHAYQNPGLYTVTLIATNTFGTDTLVRRNFINILPNLQLPAASCTSTTNQPFAGLGVIRVQFGQIDNPSNDGTDGYRDYTCSGVTTLPRDTSLTLRVTTGGLAQEIVTAYLDYDGNGTFETSERIANGNSQQGNFSATVRFSQTALVGRALRMRVMSDNVGGPPGTALAPCASIRVGQMEDYTVILTAVVSQPPVAGFSASNRTGCSGLVSFRDSSTRTPTSRLWRFGDGTTDTVAAPLHQYTTAGSYTVTLIVRNALGVDSLVRTNYVVYTPYTGLAVNSCSPSYTSNVGNGAFRSLTIGSRTVIATGTPTRPGTYQDQTCTVAPFMVNIGDSLQITTSTFGFNDQILVCVDLNNDGQFSTSEQLRRLSRSQMGGYFGGILLPAGTPTNVPMRMRMVMVSQTGGGPQPTLGVCGVMTAGQALDLVIIGQAVAPVANFTFSLPSACGTTVNFRQTSTGGPTSFAWNFGDGATSTIASPTHTYSTQGTYNVRLIVSNTLGTDTILTAVTIADGPTAAVCSPASSSVGAALNQVGITQAQILNNATLQGITRNSQSATESYQDMTCTQTLTMERGLQVLVRMRCQGSPNNQTQVHIVYLDLNNDGVLVASEEMGRVNVIGFNQSSIRFTIPTNAPLGILRLRLMAYRNGTILPTCTDIFDGQVEDYGLRVERSSSVASSVTAPAISIAPNPAKDEVRISTNLTGAGTASLQLIDALGRTVLSRTIAGGSFTEFVSVTTYPAGVYQVVVQQGKNKSLQRLVIEK